MIDSIWLIVSNTISVLVSGFSSYIFARSKYKTEVDANKIQNFDSSIAAYKKMYEDMIGDLKGQNQDLKEEVNSLKKELYQNREQLLTLTNLFLVSAMKGQTEKADPEAIGKLMDIIKYGSEQNKIEE